MNPSEEKKLIELEEQLSCPDGKIGREVADMMHKTNISMTKSSIDLLNIRDKELILEIGHGNCGHINYLLSKASSLSFIGLEISKTMKIEAENQKITSDHTRVSFDLYDGKSLPLADLSVDKILTVNTLYFWEKPQKLLHEIARVLKKNGTLIITFANKEFMETLPFVRKKFKLYNIDDILFLIKNSTLEIASTVKKIEKIKSKTGNLVNRQFTIAILKHKS